jgi:hypothetical protein
MKKVVFSVLCAVTCCIGNELPAQASQTARVCTRNYDGYLNIRRWASTSAPIDGRYLNDQTVWLDGKSYKDHYGFRWYRTARGWLRGDYLCTPPTFQVGPGNY